MKPIEKNIFVSHYHKDAASIEDLKKMLKRKKIGMRDSSIYEQKEENNAKSPDYIKQLIRPQIRWAGTVVVMIGTHTHESEWVNWEVEYAAKFDKRIVGVFLNDKSSCEIPEALKKYGDALVCWNSKYLDAVILGDMDRWDGPKRQSWLVSRQEC